MKKALVIVLLGWSISLVGMEPKTYLDLLPQDLRQELAKFTTTLEGIYTFDELQEKLSEIQQNAVHLKSPSSLVQAINNLQQQLKTIKNANYSNAMAALQVLSKDKELEFLFNNPDFNRILIDALQQENYTEKLENIAKALGTPGALEYSRQLQFIKAIKKGDIKAVKEFLDKGINVNVKDGVSNTALMITAEKGHKDIAELLLAAGANVNAKDIGGSPALMLAALYGSKSIAESLIKAGADVNAQNVRGRTALMHAADYGYKEIVELLKHHGARK